MAFTAQIASLWYGNAIRRTRSKRAVSTIKNSDGSIKVCDCFAWDCVGHVMFIEDSMDELD